MQTYSEYSPTAFDTKGLLLSDRQGWLVLPTELNRDSEACVESNFDAALVILGGESDDVEVHRFNHWAVGWIEIIIVRPGSAADIEASKIEARLEDYPYLDEEDVSSREYEEFLSSWNDWGAGQFKRDLIKEFEPNDEDKELIETAGNDVLREFFMEYAPEPYYAESSGVYINTKSAVENMDLIKFEILLDLVDFRFKNQAKESVHGKE